MSNRALGLISCVLFAVGCKIDNVLADLPEPTNLGIAFFAPVLEVGTVSRVCALGAAGYPVEGWTLSDTTFAQFESMPNPADFRYACTLLRARRVGSLTVSARVGNVIGANTVALIPVVRTIDLAPSAFSLHVGDTASVVATVISIDGDTLRGLPLAWRETDGGVVATVVTFGTGGSAHPVVQAKRSGEVQISAQVTTSRLDSATNTRGQALVSVVSTSGS